MTNETYNKALLHMIIMNHAEIQALRDFLITNFLQGKTEEQKQYAVKYFTDKVDENKKILLEQMQKYYDISDADDLLNRIFSGGGE